MLIHKKINPNGLGDYQQHFKDFSPLTKESINSMWESINMGIQELEILQYAEGWQQTGYKGSPEDLVHVFNQDFKVYCENLEKTRLLPFNFLL